MWRSLGKVTCAAAGTNYRITANLADSAARYPCFALLFEQLPGNTGYFYVLDSATGVITGNMLGTNGVIPKPSVDASSDAVILPYATVTVPQGAAPLNAADYYVTSSVNGEGILVSVVRL